LVLDDAGSDHGRNLVPARLACFHLFSTVSDISHSVLWMYLYKINFVHLLILLLARRWDSPGEIAPLHVGRFDGCNGMWRSRDWMLTSCTIQRTIYIHISILCIEILWMIS
jgi:hypothetical protein